MYICIYSTKSHLEYYVVANFQMIILWLMQFQTYGGDYPY
jgi:hypothetical protein